MVKKFLIFSLFLLFTGCSDFLNTWDAYEIKKGEHYSHRIEGIKGISLKSGRHLHFKARFTSSCLYSLSGMGEDSLDINKLYGFTDSNSLVHENSIRIGWRHNGNGKIEVFAYWYANTVLRWYKLGETLPYIEDEYELWARNGVYYFRFNEEEYSTMRVKDAENGIRIRLFPYFGGNKAASNDILIFIYEYS